MAYNRTTSAQLQARHMTYNQTLHQEPPPRSLTLKGYHPQKTGIVLFDPKLSPFLFSFLVSNWF